MCGNLEELSRDLALSSVRFPSSLTSACSYETTSYARLPLLMCTCALSYVLSRHSHVLRNTSNRLLLLMASSSTQRVSVVTHTHTHTHTFSRLNFCLVHTPMTCEHGCTFSSLLQVRPVKYLIMSLNLRMPLVVMIKEGLNVSYPASYQHTPSQTAPPPSGGISEEDKRRTTQLISLVKEGREVHRLKEPRNLYAHVSHNLSPRNLPLWLDHLQLLLHNLFMYLTDACNTRNCTF